LETTVFGVVVLPKFRSAHANIRLNIIDDVVIELHRLSSTRYMYESNRV